MKASADEDYRPAEAGLHPWDDLRLNVPCYICSKKRESKDIVCQTCWKAYDRECLPTGRPGINKAFYWAVRKTQRFWSNRLEEMVEQAERLLAERDALQTELDELKAKVKVRDALEIETLAQSFRRVEEAEKNASRVLGVLARLDDEE